MGREVAFLNSWHKSTIAAESRLKPAKARRHMGSGSGPGTPRRLSSAGGASGSSIGRLNEAASERLTLCAGGFVVMFARATSTTTPCPSTTSPMRTKGRGGARSRRGAPQRRDRRHRHPRSAGLKRACCGATVRCHPRVWPKDPALSLLPAPAVANRPRSRELGSNPRTNPRMTDGESTKSMLRLVMP